MSRDKIIEKFLDQMAERNNTIDLDAYAKGLCDMYYDLLKDRPQFKSGDNITNGEVDAKVIVDSKILYETEVVYSHNNVIDKINNVGWALKPRVGKKTETMGWISVRDDLPETNLGISFKHSKVVAVLTTDVNYPTTARLENGMEPDNTIPYWYDLLTDSIDLEVTHWMPLHDHPNQ